MNDSPLQVGLVELQKFIINNYTLISNPNPQGLHSPFHFKVTMKIVL